MKMNKRITTIKLTLFLCLLTFMSSCVETDLYELYDDNDFIQGYAPRQKNQKKAIIHHIHAAFVVLLI